MTEGNKYLVSIRLLTYNHELYILEALDGINIQDTKFRIEVVVGDDFSTDNTIEIIKNYNFTNPNVNIKILKRAVGDEYYKKRKKFGRLFNFIDTLRNCEGSYIALLDGDDYWIDPLKLKRQIDVLDNNKDISVCFHKANYLIGKKIIVPRKDISKIEEPFLFSSLIENYNFITTSSVVYRNPKYLYFPRWFFEIPYGDLGLYKLISEYGKFYCLDETMSVYRKNENGIYSGLKKNENRRIYLNFLNVIYPALNKDENRIARIKINEICNRLSSSSNPNSIWIKFLKVQIKLTELFLQRQFNRRFKRIYFDKPMECID